MSTRITKSLLTTLKGISTATLTMQLFYRGYANCFINGVKPLNPAAARFAAPAFTLRYIPSREDVAVPERWKDRDYPQRKAIESAPAGTALVIDQRGDLRAGAAGDILITRLQQRGVVALVTDGALRDTPAIAELAFPAFCAGAAAPASMTTLFAADLQTPIGCGGVAIFPGDLLVGDAEGVVVIPRGLAKDIAEDGAEQELFESYVQERVEQGASTFGLYPPDEQTLADFERWRKAGR